MIELISHRADLKPNSFTLLTSAQFPLPVVQGLQKLYASPHKDLRLIASLINHCFTSRTDVVMVSRPILQDVVEQDSNIANKFTVSMAVYKGFTSYLSKGLLLVQLAPSCRREKGQKGRAAVYQLSKPMQAYLSLTAEEVAAIEACLAALNKA